MQHRRLRPAIVVAIAVAMLAVLLAMAFCGGLYLSAQQIKTELAKIRAAGEPITMADLEAFYSLPADTRDATDLWLAVVEETDSEAYKTDAADLMTGKFTDLMPNERPWLQQAEAEQFLFEHADVLRKVHDAAAMGGAARYPTHFSDDPGNATMALFQSRLTRHIGALLLLEAKVHACRGDAHAASDSVHAIFSLTHSLERAPFFVSVLLRMATDENAINCFERLLAMVDLSDSDLARIDKDLAAIDYREGFHRAMLGERVFTMQIFGHPDVLGGQASKWGRWSIVRQTDFAVYLQLIDGFVAASKSRNISSLRTAMDRAEQCVKEVVGAPGAQWRYRMTSLLSPSLEHLADSVCRGTAKRDIARLAIAVERYRRVQGRFPDSLDELVPNFAANVPVDPFRAATLECRVTDDECRIYSVGPDGTDQGGSDERAGVVGDIVFHLSPRNRPKRSTADK